MPNIVHAAKFSRTDTQPRILEDLACPACGRQEPADASTRITDNKIRIFCEGCGAFITVLLNDEQANALRRGGIAGSTGG